MSELFSYLKAQTRDAHEALEAHYPFNRMLKPQQFAKQDYVHILQVLAAFHRHVKSWLTTLAPAHTAMLETDAVEAALRADLAQLHTTPLDGPETFSITLPAVSPESRGLAAAYVWMGSSLGGKIIARWISKTYPDLPIAYYSQMKNVSRNWPQFIQAVSTAYRLSDAQLAQTADCATAIFTGLRETAGNLTRHADIATD